MKVERKKVRTVFNFFLNGLAPCFILVSETKLIEILEDKFSFFVNHRISKHHKLLLAMEHSTDSDSKIKPIRFIDSFKGKNKILVYSGFMYRVSKRVKSTSYFVCHQKQWVLRHNGFV